MNKLTVLEVSNLSKSYGKIKAVDNIGFKLEEGQILGLIGPNGSGKSTTIKSLLHLLRKDNGDIKFFNKPLEKNLEMIFKFVGYVSSENTLYEYMTANEFFKYSNSFYEADYFNNIEILAKRLKLDLNQKIKQMSLGNKRKVAIINAFFHEPKIIILDEPTNGLDPLTRLEFEKILKEERKKGNSILYSSHNLSEIASICDEVLIIKNGKLIPNISLKTIKNAHKKVNVVTKEQTYEYMFDKDKIKDLVIDKNNVSFLYLGEMKYLLKKLESIDTIDLTIENPSLEEIFIHFYDESN